MYFNKTHAQTYVNFIFYILFIALDICKKYVYMKLHMFWHLGKECQYNFNPKLCWVLLIKWNASHVFLVFFFLRW
jgi:hypothetical protein